ncbi:MAG: helix-turn-helix transcriptional regulator [Clostridia bacterium]|nr:helix-turn-helix transcriptional regulator [Clostridia bacterium]
MDYASLYDTIRCLTYGTRLHVGVLFFGKYGNKKLTLPHEQTIHAAPVCEALKNTSARGYERCFLCRNTAIRCAMQQKKPFGGLCINGVYEYTHPVTDDADELICMIYIGNILTTGRGEKKLCRHLGAQANLTETMQADFDEVQCRALARVLESYIRMLLSLYPTDRTPEGMTPMIENIKRYVTSNPGGDVSISELASIFHYNEKYLGRLFKRETGKTIHEYVNEKRIKRAEQLLLSTDDSIIDISERIGFNNVTYFNRIFKKHHGKSPAAYRKDVRMYPELQ